MKIIGAGKIVWGIAAASLATAVAAIMLTLGSAGTTSPATGTYAAFAGSAASLTLGPTVAYTALIIAVSGGGMSALNKLRKYKVIKKRDRYILKKSRYWLNVKNINKVGIKMLNKKNRVEAVNSLKREIKKFDNEKTYLVTQSEKLYKERLVLKDNVKKIWQFLNSMRNKPEDIKIEVEKLKIEFKKFENFVVEINEEVEASLKKTAGSAGGGVVAGVGVAAFGPSAAMAIATTFGTASTGTAISALSGAAATNAALAWLGGGALVAGGGGTAAGSALLALSGPIGWSIGGVSLATAGLLRNSKNKKVANEARTKEIEVQTQIKMLKGTSEEIIETTKLTETTNNLIDPFYDDVLNRTVRYKSDYKEIKEARDNDLIKDLGSLINQTKGAIELLNRAIGKVS